MISVIIPVYNGAEFLEESVRSVMKQSYADLEIIVIDDGSTDDSYEICQRLALEDERIRLIHQENMGVSATRNRALSLVSGEYIMFVDSDDILLQNAAEALLSAMTNDVDYVIASHTDLWHGNHKNFVRKSADYDFDAIKSNIEELDDLLFPPWGKLFRRYIIDDNQIVFDVDMPLGEDHIFNLEYCKCARKTRIISEIVYIYRKGGMATTVKYYSNRQQISLKILNAYCNLFDGKDNVPLMFMKKMVRDHLLGCVEHYLGHCNYQEALLKTTQTIADFGFLLTPSLVDTDFFAPKTVQCIREHDAKGLMMQVVKNKWLRLIYKKIKRLYYTFFSKRI